MSEKSNLVRQDPESEACFETLRGRIFEELSARIDFGDDPTTKEGQIVLSTLVADAILDVFIVRIRNTPRYKWEEN